MTRLNWNVTEHIKITCRLFLFGLKIVKNNEIWRVTCKKCDRSSTDCHCNGLFKGRRTLSLKLWNAPSFTDPNCCILQILGKSLLAGQHKISLSSQSSVVTHPASTINELLSNDEKHWVLHGILAVGLNVSTEQSAWFEHGQHLWPPAELNYKILRLKLALQSLINPIPCQKD